MRGRRICHGYPGERVGRTARLCGYQGSEEPACTCETEVHTGGRKPLAVGLTCGVHLRARDGAALTLEPRPVEARVPGFQRVRAPLVLLAPVHQIRDGPSVVGECVRAHAVALAARCGEMPQGELPELLQVQLVTRTARLFAELYVAQVAPPVLHCAKVACLRYRNRAGHFNQSLPGSNDTIRLVSREGQVLLSG